MLRIEDFPGLLQSEEADVDASYWPPPPCSGPIRPPVGPPPVDNGGLRFNDGKDRWDLLPWDALEALVRIYTKGGVKYAPRNWERGMHWSKMVASMMRHFIRRVVYREVIDPETGELHFGHMAWNALGLLTYDLRNIGNDDITMEVSENEL